MTSGWVIRDLRIGNPWVENAISAPIKPPATPEQRFGKC